MTMPPLLALLARHFIGITGILMMLATSRAYAQEPPEDVLAGIAARLDHARHALAKAGPRLGVAERRLLATQLADAEQALQEVRTLARQGKWREGDRWFFDRRRCPSRAGRSIHDARTWRPSWAMR